MQIIGIIQKTKEFRKAHVRTGTNNVLRMECVEPGEMWRVQSSRHGTDPKRRIKKRSQFSRKKPSVSLSPFEEIDNLERHASGRKQSGRCSGRKRCEKHGKRQGRKAADQHARFFCGDDGPWCIVSELMAEWSV